MDRLLRLNDTFRLLPRPYPVENWVITERHLYRTWEVWSLDGGHVLARNVDKSDGTRCISFRQDDSTTGWTPEFVQLVTDRPPCSEVTR